MEELFKSISDAIAKYENENDKIVGCYISCQGICSNEKPSKFEYNGADFHEQGNLVIYKRWTRKGAIEHSDQS